MDRRPTFIEDWKLLSAPPIYDRFLNSWWPSFLFGNVLILSWPYADFADVVFNSALYAPNPQCDSPGLVLWSNQLASMFLLPIVNAATLLSTWHLIRRKEKVRFRKKSNVRYAIAVIVFGVLTTPFLVQLVQSLMDIWPHEITGDCNGKAEPYTRTVYWKPSVINELWIGMWVFFCSVLAVSIVSQNTVKTD